MAARSYWAAPVTPLTTADGTAFTGLALADISPSPTARAVPAYVPDSGTILRLRATLNYTSTSATPTLTLGFYWGGVAGVAIASLAGLVTSASAVAWPVIMEWQGEFRVLGTAGQLRGSGKLYWPGSLTSFITPAPAAILALPATSAARTVTVSTAANQLLTVGAIWSSATGTPSITCETFHAEMIG